MNVTTSNKRLLALDVMRGITIAGMILVNTPGSWQHAYAPLKHAEWIGLTPTDLVFPFFMFIMGISTYISLRKYNFTFSVPAGLKILKRTVIIFLIGIGISWLSILCFQHDPFPIDQIRILGVMQRLALGYDRSVRKSELKSDVSWHGDLLAMDQRSSGRYLLLHSLQRHSRYIRHPFL